VVGGKAALPGGLPSSRISYYIPVQIAIFTIERPGCAGKRPPAPASGSEAGAGGLDSAEIELGECAD